jgi:hypothetical protein
MQAPLTGGSSLHVYVDEAHSNPGTQPTPFAPPHGWPSFAAATQVVPSHVA